MVNTAAVPEGNIPATINFDQARDNHCFNFPSDSLPPVAPRRPPQQPRDRDEAVKKIRETMFGQYTKDQFDAAALAVS